MCFLCLNNFVDCVSIGNKVVMVRILWVYDWQAIDNIFQLWVMIGERLATDWQKQRLQ
jgi:hypothetical protein